MVLKTLDVVSLTKHKPPMLMMIFRIILIVTTSIDIILRPQLAIILKAAFIFGILLLHLNDHLRNRFQFFENNRMIYYLSMMTSIVGTGLYLIRFDSLPLNFYFVFQLSRFSSIALGFKSDCSSSMFSYFWALCLSLRREFRRPCSRISPCCC